MFTQARYVIVDDDETELRQLSEALQQIGAPCLPLRYDEAAGIDPRHLGGVRLLFLDLHLTTGSQSSDTAQSAGVIAAMLEDGISPTAGPYVIILWTKHAAQHGAFQTYIMDNLDAAKRPLAILNLDKLEYMAKGAGQKLVDDVTRIIASDPRLRALLDWEREVLKAAASTLSEVGMLVADEDRTAARFSDRLDEVLSLLAEEAVGRANAKADPYSAVNAALMPILSDRIANQRTGEHSQDIWTRAVTKIGDVAAPTLQDAARLNSMLHIAPAASEEQTSGSWGAVTVLGEGELADDVMNRRFGVPAGPLLSGVFCLTEKAERARSRICMLRIGASCDYAQGKRGPIPFMLGAIVPAAAKRRLANLPKAEIATPPILLDGFEEPVRIIFNAHLSITLVPEDFVAWSSLCRLREALLVQVTTHGAHHSTRPAIISFNAAEPEAT